MNAHVRHPIALASTFLWVGFVAAISFMEAWLKFRAPGITLPLGLGIGRLVFAALNKVEWVLALAVLLELLFNRRAQAQAFQLLFALAFLILLVQTFYLLPVLDYRAQMQIEGMVMPPSGAHIFYIVLEGLKVICLLAFGVSLFRQRRRRTSVERGVVKPV